MNTIVKILEMIRFSHTLFALPFALLAAVMAWKSPDPSGLPESVSSGFRWLHLAGVLICMVAARSAAMAFNRLADRRIDADNPRTAKRHLPSGELSVPAVSLFTLASSLMFVGGTCLFLPNWLPLAVSLPVLGVLLGYSYAKRFTAMAHFWLGFALMLSPICVWLAIRGLVVLEQPGDMLPALALGLAVMFWVAGFDMIYACQDFEFDRDRKLNSIPVRLGVSGALRLAAVCHVLMVGVLAGMPFLTHWGAPLLDWGWIYGVAVVLVAGLLVYEHAIVKPEDLQRVNVAFFNVNAIVSLGLLLTGVVDLVFV